MDISPQRWHLSYCRAFPAGLPAGLYCKFDDSLRVAGWCRNKFISRTNYRNSTLHGRLLSGQPVLCFRAKPWVSRILPRPGMLGVIPISTSRNLESWGRQGADGWRYGGKNSGTAMSQCPKEHESKGNILKKKERQRDQINHDVFQQPVFCSPCFSRPIGFFALFQKIR